MCTLPLTPSPFPSLPRTSSASLPMCTSLGLTPVLGVLHNLLQREPLPLVVHSTWQHLQQPDHVSLQHLSRKYSKPTLEPLLRQASHSSQPRSCAGPAHLQHFRDEPVHDRRGLVTGGDQHVGWPHALEVLCSTEAWAEGSRTSSPKFTLYLICPLHHLPSMYTRQGN